jgi:BON domain
MRKADDQIRKEVLEEVEWDSRLASSSVGACVDGGVLTLIGTTNSSAKLAAREGAHRVPGVLDVANDIEVRTVGKAARDDRLDLFAQETDHVLRRLEAEGEWE